MQAKKVSCHLFVEEAHLVESPNPYSDVSHESAWVKVTRQQMKVQSWGQLHFVQLKTVRQKVKGALLIEQSSTV